MVHDPAPSVGATTHLKQYLASTVPFLHMLEIKDEEHLRKWLTFADIDYEAWATTPGAKPFSRLANDILVEGSVVLVLRIVEGVPYLVRYLRTLSLRVEFDLHAPSLLNLNRIIRLHLREFIEKVQDGRTVYVPRRHKYPSEKFTWGETDPVAVAIRLGKEEHDIVLTCEEDLTPDRFRDMHAVEHQWDDFTVQRHAIADFERSDASPGCWTHNEIVRKVLTLRKKHFRPKGYREPGTNYVSKWVTDDGTLYKG